MMMPSRSTSTCRARAAGKAFPLSALQTLLLTELKKTPATAARKRCCGSFIGRPVSWVPHPVLAELRKANVWEKLVLKPVRLRPGGDHARREEHGQGGCQAQDQGGIDELRATHEQLCSILTHTPRQPA